MFSRKNLPAVCIITSGDETISLALGALGKLNRKALLILHGNFTRRAVRRMGYCGPLKIINSETDAVSAIIDEISHMKNPPEWTIFINECDMLISLDIPTVPGKHFAIMNNRVVIYGGLANLMRVMATPRNYAIDGKNVVLQRPTLNYHGAFLRTKCLLAARDSIGKSDNLVAAMQATLPNSSPIYMDAVNIVEINRNFCARKGRAGNIKKSANL